MRAWEGSTTAPPPVPTTPVARPPRTGARRRIALVATAVAVGALGVVVWQRARPAAIQPGALFVGDSVTYLAASPLEEATSGDAVVLARVGYRSTDLLPLFEQAAAERSGAPDQLRQVGLLVGYNDVLHDEVDLDAQRRVMAVADRFDCAVWLTLPSVPMHTEEADEWNRGAVVAARSFPHVHIVDDWRRAVDAAPPGELVTSADGVHPTPRGAERLAQIFTQAIRRAC